MKQTLWLFLIIKFILSQQIKNTGTGYLIGTEEIKKLDRNTQKMVPKRIPVLKKRTHAEVPEATVKPMGGERSWAGQI